MQCLQYDELRYDTTNHPDSRGVLPVKRVFTGCTVKTGFYRETYGFTCFYRTSDFMTGFTGSRQLCNGNGILDSSFLDRQSLFFGAPVKTGFYRNSLMSMDEYAVVAAVVVVVAAAAVYLRVGERSNEITQQQPNSTEVI